MSDPSRSTDAEPPTDVDEDEYPDVEAEPTEPTDRTVEAEPAGRTERTADAEADAEARAEEDAEEVESEWHVWLLAALVVIGIALFFAPRFFLPELVGSLGLLLVAIGAIGWIVKWAIARTA